MVEDDVFKKAQINFDKIKNYGFVKSKDGWNIKKDFMEGDFRADINISAQGKVSGKVFDVQNGEEYLLFRVKNAQEGFASKVKDEYEKILFDILEKCFDEKYFISDQANRICELIYQKYDIRPDFPWKNQKVASDAGVFRKKSQKWFALMMNIKMDRLMPKAKGEIDIINLKLDEAEIKTLINKQGFYPAYHMNKKSWITISLDEALLDETIMEYVSKSYENVR